MEMLFFLLSSPGFIDFIVEPTFSVLVDTTEKIISPLIEEALRAGDTGVPRSRYCTSHSQSLSLTPHLCVCVCAFGPVWTLTLLCHCC